MREGELGKVGRVTLNSKGDSGEAGRVSKDGEKGGGQPSEGVKSKGVKAYRPGERRGRRAGDGVQRLRMGV
jgi:hypothetical protein